MEVYHGSFTNVLEPLAMIGRRNLDFGRGFYVTRFKEQAQKWAILVANRKSVNHKGVVNIYQLMDFQQIVQKYIFKIFETYDIEWLDFVVSCRQGRDVTNYDIVEGGIANDQVIDTIEDYENGRITAVQALGQLQYKNPNNQICIRTQEIIERYLHYIGKEEINPNENEL